MLSKKLHLNQGFDGGLLGCDAEWFCMWIPTFRRNILPPSSALKREAVCSSKTLVFTYTFTRPHNSEDQHRHLYRPENLTSDRNQGLLMLGNPDLHSNITIPSSGSHTSRHVKWEHCRSESLCISKTKACKGYTGHFYVLNIFNCLFTAHLKHTEHRPLALQILASIGNHLEQVSKH
jgi:hypothetical protein